MLIHSKVFLAPLFIKEKKICLSLLRNHLGVEEKTSFVGIHLMGQFPFFQKKLIFHFVLNL